MAIDERMGTPPATPPKRMTMRNIRGFVDDVRAFFKESQAVTPVVWMIGGVIVAFAVEHYGPDPDPTDFAITVSQARASLLSALALVFTGLSIVLALTALAAGNTAGKFSPRLLRMRLRGGGNKLVLGVFSLTASFILASQILLRGIPSDSLAPPLTMLVAVFLLLLTGVTIVWYINGTLQSMRVDRAISWIGGRILAAMKHQEHAQRHDTILGEIDLERPADAVDLTAPDNGYLVGVDTNRLHRVATGCDGCVVIGTATGGAVAEGEVIGWVSAPSRVSRRELDDIAEGLAVGRTRDPDRDVGYTIGVLVDIALMALSPAVNDPWTGVGCTEALTTVWTAMSQLTLGIRTRQRSDGSPSVVVIEATVGDFLDAAGRQILLYGRDDRTVTAALLRMARQAERTARHERDRRLAAALASDVEAVRAGTSSHGRCW